MLHSKYPTQTLAFLRKSRMDTAFRWFQKQRIVIKGMTGNQQPVKRSVLLLETQIIWWSLRCSDYHHICESATVNGSTEPFAGLFCLSNCQRLASTTSELKIKIFSQSKIAPLSISSPQNFSSTYNKTPPDAQAVFCCGPYVIGETVSGQGL